MSVQNEKCIMVIDESLPPGIIAKHGAAAVTSGQRWSAGFRGAEIMRSLHDIF